MHFPVTWITNNEVKYHDTETRIPVKQSFQEGNLQAGDKGTC
jgi:hypothetical protein